MSVVDYYDILELALSCFLLLLTLRLICWQPLMHRIGRGKEQVWFNDNFLRGVPEYLERLVRTKIKGDNTFVGIVPNFDDMPPLPICNKQPSDVLDEMEKAILKMKSSSHMQPGLVMPPNNNGTDRQTLLHDATDLSFSPRSENSREFGVDFNNNNPEEHFMPPSLPSSNFNGSHSFPSVHVNSPFQADTHSSATMAYTYQACFEEMPQQVQSPMLRVQAPKSGVCFSPIKHGDQDFEPLPFRVGDNSCVGDEFANFIGSTIRHIEGE